MHADLFAAGYASEPAGTGGYAAILRVDGHEHTLTGSHPGPVGLALMEIYALGVGLRRAIDLGCDGVELIGEGRDMLTDLAAAVPPGRHHTAWEHLVALWDRFPSNKRRVLVARADEGHPKLAICAKLAQEAAGG